MSECSVKITADVLNLVKGTRFDDHRTCVTTSLQVLQPEVEKSAQLIMRFRV